MSDPIRILVVDDQAIVRAGLCAMLEMKAGLEVIGVAADGYEAVEQAAALHPDVILMDLVMPRKNGVCAIRDIMAQQPEARILVLSSFSDDAQSVEAVRAGARGYVLKSARPEELVTAIHQVYTGEMPINGVVARKLVKSMVPTAEPTLKELLTDREMEVARLIAQGRGNSDIADELEISIRTVGTHISNILEKAGVNNRTQLTLLMLKQGFSSLYDN